MNEHSLKTLHGNSNKGDRGLLYLICEKSSYRLEYNLSLQGHRYALRRCHDSKKKKKYRSASVHIQLMYSLFVIKTGSYKVEDRRTRQILSGVIQGTYNFPNIFSDISQVLVSLQVWGGFNSQQTPKPRHLHEETSVHCFIRQLSARSAMMEYHLIDFRGIECDEFPPLTKLLEFGQRRDKLQNSGHLEF